MAASNQTRAESVSAIERATARQWSEWLEYFEQHRAQTLSHAEIAQLARRAMPTELANPDWWAQGTAIAFEQQMGLRVPGQSSDGSFRVGASRTLTKDRDTAIELWIAGPGAADTHLGYTVVDPRRSRTEKRSFFRFTLEGAGRVEVSATPNPKNPEKTTLTVSHDNLPDAELIESWRAHWKTQLAALD